MNILLLKKLIIAFVVIIGLSSCTDKPTTNTTTGDTATPTPATPTPTTPTPTTPTTTPVSVNLSASSFQVLNNGLDVVTITATVLDASNAVVSNATILFSATGGILGAASGITDTDGKVEVIFTSGSSGFNATETITATLSGITPAVTRQIPIQVVGTTAELVANNTNITDDGVTQDTLTITVKNAGNAPLFDAPVTVTQTGTGSATLVQSATNTDVNGVVTLNVAGTSAGSLTLTVNVAGVTATQAYVVSTTGTAFGITSPAADPYALSTAGEIAIVVNTPGVTTATFATSLGGVSATPAGVKTPSLDIAVVGGVATAYLSSTTAGIANVQVFDAANIAITDSIKVAVSQPSTAASTISLTTDVAVVAPSVGDTTNAVTLTATVRSASGQVVGGAPVIFTIPNPTGGGETISPVIAYTNSQGEAVTTFTSGSLSSSATGVVVNANVISPAVGPATTNIVIGGTAGSVVIGLGTSISILSPTSYQLPVTVLVADGNGNAVANADVTLNIWPTFYSFGFWRATGGTSSDCVVERFSRTISPTFNIPNEDLNKNLLLDAGEDLTFTVSTATVDAYGAITLRAPFANPSNDGSLTPANSSAGSLPSVVTTDANGVANFSLTYLKQHAAWVTVEITASTQVLGTESLSKIEFKLPFTSADAAACVLPNSPFNEGAW